MRDYGVKHSRSALSGQGGRVRALAMSGEILRVFSVINCEIYLNFGGIVRGLSGQREHRPWLWLQASIE